MTQHKTQSDVNHDGPSSMADASTDRGYETKAGRAAATKKFPHHAAKLHDHPQTPEHGEGRRQEMRRCHVIPVK